jgi:hypothetical protein
VGDRDAGVGGGRDSGGHAWHHLEVERRLGEGLRFLSPTAEDERISALQAYDALPRANETNEKAVDVLLRRRLPVPSLADVVELGGGSPRAIEKLGVRQRVVDDDVAFVQELPPANGQKAGVAGPRADQVGLSPLRSPAPLRHRVPSRPRSARRRRYRFRP